MKEIKGDIKEISRTIGNINITLAKQEENLKEHMRRTQAAEARLEHIEDNIEPIKSHVNKMNGALKLLSVVSVLVAIAVSISKFL